MGDLQVDYDRLTTSATTLQSLKREFDGIEHRADRDGTFWSHSAVSGAMREFATNMDYNRAKLSERLQHCGEKVESTLQAFREVDEKLSDELERSTR